MSEYTPPREVDDAPSLMQRHAENKNALAYLEEVIARKNERIADLERRVETLTAARMNDIEAFVKLREAVEKIKTEESWYGVLSRAWVVQTLEAALGSSNEED